jgi:nucleoid DNA-binding protein|tara:strand:- start:345 stop:596 length:252 start_codon:yes stop_codon:yes gene_type:complete
MKKKEKKKNRSKLNDIVAEIAHDLGIDRRLVRQVLVLLFKEIAIILVLRGKPVMIRRFVKFVIAINAARKIKKAISKLKTKMK